jgi:tetratricopeptide (TPR) repeat protein
MLALAELAAPELQGDEQRAWLDRLERDHDNLRAALDRAATRPDPSTAARLTFAIWRFWQQRGYLNEARARVDAMAAQGWDLEPIDRARFAEAAGGIAYWQSDQPVATVWYQEALDLWRELGDKREIANALYNRAYADVIEVMKGAREPQTLLPGQAMLEEALVLFRETGDKRGEANVIWGLGSFHYFGADAGKAEDWYRRSLELHQEAGDRTMAAWSRHMLALSLTGQQRWDDALVESRLSLREFYEAGDVAGVTLVMDDLAIIATGMGDTERAGRLWGAARHLQRTTGTALADYVQQTNVLFGVPTPFDAVAPDVLDRYAAEGAAMSFDDIVAYALEQPSAGRAPSQVEVSS